MHGYFEFEEQRAGEVSDFSSLFGLEMARREDHFTFAALQYFPDYTLAGKVFSATLATIATQTFAGYPRDVLWFNSMVYNFNTGMIVPIASIVNTVSLDIAGNYFLSPGLILPGSLTAEGTRVTDYSAWFSTDTMKFKYSEVTTSAA